MNGMNALVACLPVRKVRVLLAAVSIVGFCGVASAQANPAASTGSPMGPSGSALPAAQPTAAGTTPVASLPSEPVRMHAAVEFTDGKLMVDATNASLNQILREVAQKTGIKITGGVSDERVFGHYGPDTMPVVLAALLDGTTSNMLLVDDANGSSELVLTPRQGGPTPPNPNAAQQEADAAAESNPDGEYIPPTRPYRPPVPTGRGPIGANANGSPAFLGGGDTNQGTDGAKTAQQIYDQLQSEARRQQANPAPQNQAPQ